MPDFLQEVIDFSQGKIEQIVVRFQEVDLLLGVSDLKIFDLCVENKIKLFRNPRLHAKCIINEHFDCILGSSNYTNNGKNSNLEFNTHLCELDTDSQILIESIKLDSIPVSREWVDYMRNLIAEHSFKIPDVELPIIDSTKDFLLSALPISANPSRLFEIMNKPNDFPCRDFEKEAAIHDLTLYNLTSEDLKNRDIFMNQLKRNFLKHPFIKAFLDFVFSKSSRICGFTEACIWISKHCEDVPIPSRYSIRDDKIVDPLFSWCDSLVENIINDNRYAEGKGTNKLIIQD
jgi:hypothetical protein